MMRVLSLGAGVQSTTLALMAAHGEIEPPDAAIFAGGGHQRRNLRPPLDEADLGDEDTIDMFGNECEGMCGV